jgi:hypothetical protein
MKVNVLRKEKLGRNEGMESGGMLDRN